MEKGIETIEQYLNICNTLTKRNIEEIKDRVFLKSVDRLRENIIDKGIRKLYCDGWYCRKLEELLEDLDIEICALHICKKANIYKGIEFTNKDCLIVSEYMVNTFNDNIIELIKKANDDAGLVSVLTEDMYLIKREK